MKRILNIIFLSTLGLMMVAIIGCSSSTKIGDITANSAQYEGKDLTIRGTVGETAWFALLGKGAYQLGDGSGNIWVTQPPPQKGQSITAEGKSQAAFSLAGQSYGTVLPKRRGVNLFEGPFYPGIFVKKDLEPQTTRPGWNLLYQAEKNPARFSFIRPGVNHILSFPSPVHFRTPWTTLLPVLFAPSSPPFVYLSNLMATIYWISKLSLTHLSDTSTRGLWRVSYKYILTE